MSNVMSKMTQMEMQKQIEQLKKELEGLKRVMKMMKIPLMQEEIEQLKKENGKMKKIEQLKKEIEEHEAVEAYMMKTIKEGGSYDDILHAH